MIKSWRIAKIEKICLADKAMYVENVEVSGVVADKTRLSFGYSSHLVMSLAPKCASTYRGHCARPKSKCQPAATTKS